ncbi:hypothetical protein MO867_04320 [Microbulbifer sp. OS29]|uniref:DUF6868 domain-containing protein n=1 Tax=Microbulbifer okhotskensis TaxID=2926617 RepID=A0A9X2EM13_9GAMM|nr:hypothetical protein [Microbulbifer okhotskensis]MCO1333560.1 hypothetical protein [Microbulbifer okhotskensis]
MTIENLTQFLGWTSIINAIILLLSTLGIVTRKEVITRVHARIFRLNEQDLGRAYFQYLAQYKIFIIGFNIVPYIALKIIS